MTARGKTPATGERPCPKTDTLSPEETAALWALEERFWTGGLDSARVTSAKNAVMIFPYPSGILQGDQIWRHLKQGTVWRSVELSDRSATRHGDLAVLAYRVSAERADAPIYAALCATTYLRDDHEWLRMSHQQTPVT